MVDAMGANRYPDGQAHRLRRKLALHLGVRVKELALGNGSNELIELLVRTFCTNRHHIVFGKPSFMAYRLIADAHGFPFTDVALGLERFDLAAMAEAVRPDTRIVFIANPNNPTGTYAPKAQIRDFLRRVGREILVVIDEAYFEYATAPDFPDSLTLRDLHPRVVTLRTFSKAYGLAGLRVGYLVAAAGLVEYINRVRAPFNVNSVAQAAGAAALEDQAHLRRVVATNQRQRTWLSRQLEGLGFRVIPSQTNFLLVRPKQAAGKTHAFLGRAGVIVRLVGDLPEHLRITVGSPAENRRLVAALASFPRETWRCRRERATFRSRETRAQSSKTAALSAEGGAVGAKRS